jgi:hypothetical protein
MPERSTVKLPDGQSMVISALGSDLTIQQTSDRLTVALANHFPEKWVVMLDGSESRLVSIRDDIGAKDDQTFRGEWRDETLLIHITQSRTYNDGRSGTGKRTFELSLNPDGTLRVGMAISNDGTMGWSVYRWLEAAE